MSKLLEQIVGSNLPNGYIYRAASGTDYFYNAGSWVNCNSMSRVYEHMAAEFDDKAKQQITEHNAKNILQIGRTYKLKEGSYEYVGRGILTKNGSFITEAEQNSVLKMITESSAVKLLQVPAGYKFEYVLTHEGDDDDSKDQELEFIKNESNEGASRIDTSWSNSAGIKLTQEQASEVTAAALKEINRYNANNDYKIGTTVRIMVNGQEHWYTFVGNAFTLDGSTKRYEEGTKPFNRIMNEMDNSDDVFLPTGGSKSDLDNVLKRLSTGEIEGRISVGSPDKSTEDSSDNSTEEPSEENNDSTDSSTEDSSEPEVEDEPVKPAPDAAPELPPAKVKEPETVLPDPEEGVDEGDVEKQVPNGFAVQSNSGKKYYKRDGKWFNYETHKELNSSAAKLVERNAAQTIAAYNQQYSGKRIPIGQEYTSKMGNVYTWNGNQFYDAKGKALPTAVADVVVNKVKQELGISDKPQDAPQDEPQDSSTDSTDNSDSTVNGNDGSTGEPTPAPEAEPAPSDEDDIKFDEPSDAPKEEPKAEPKASEPVNAKQDSESEDDFLKRLAGAINQNPNKPRIAVLLGRNDPVALLAADILLNNQQEEARKIIMSLKNNDSTQ